MEFKAAPFAHVAMKCSAFQAMVDVTSFEMALFRGLVSTEIDVSLAAQNQLGDAAAGVLQVGKGRSLNHHRFRMD